MSNKKAHRKRKQAVGGGRVARMVESIVTGAVSGIVAAAVIKLLGW